MECGTISDVNENGHIATLSPDSGGILFFSGDILLGTQFHELTAGQSVWFNREIVHSDAFLNLPAGTSRITEPPKAKSKTWDTFTYYECSMGITVRRGVDGVFTDDKA